MQSITKPHKTIIYIPLALMLAVSAFFLMFPEADLWVSSLYYEEGRGFAHKVGFWGAVYYAVPWVVKILIPGVLLAILWGHLRKRPVLGLTKRKGLFLLLALALGPGLAVNTVFKNQWGRARPHQIEAFGGEAAFTPAWVLTDQCETNCSFVSGHASMGFFVMALAFIFPQAFWRWVILGVGLGMLVGWARIVQGGHFISDVILCGFVVYWMALVSAKMILYYSGRKKA